MLEFETLSNLLFSMLCLFHRLTVHGMNQAISLGEALKNESITHIFSSDLKRAHRTAFAIANHHPHLPVHTHASLRERDFGELEGKPWRHAHLTKDLGERRPLLQARALAAWKWIFEEAGLLDVTSNSVIVVVSHGTFLGFLLDTICSFYNSSRPERVSWRNTAYAKLVITPGDTADLRIDCINDTRHLQHIKRQRGGVGSMKYDVSQKPLADFFVSSKKLSLDSGNNPSRVCVLYFLYYDEKILQTCSEICNAEQVFEISV